MTKEQKRKAAMFHACRMSFVWGQENGGSWHLMLHALREVLCPELATYTLSTCDYERCPELAELVSHLRKATGE